MSLLSLGRGFVVKQRLATPAQARSMPAAPDTPPLPPDRLDGFTKYIPVETIMLFVAGLSTIAAISAAFPTITKWHLYGLCALLTPVILWLSAFGAFRSNGGTGTFAPPWWRMIAATCAFMVWSLSVPLMLEDALQPVAGIGALFISTILTLFDPIFDRRA